MSAVLPSAHREFVVGDLDEQFSVTVSARGRVAAWRRYWSQALRGAWHGTALRARRSQVPGVPGDNPRRSFDMSGFWRDLRLGVRTAIGSPAYSAIAIVTLALAIGANTLLFSIANPLVFKGLPIKDPDTLGWIVEDNDQAGAMRAGASMPDFLEWRAASRSFSSLGARALAGATMGIDGDAERVQTVRATANLCDIWGLRPALGRIFQAGDDTPGRAPVVVLSHHFWKGRFQADPAVIGRSITIDGAPATIVGVMAPDIEIAGYAKIDLWAPLPLDPSAPRSKRDLKVVGRLAKGASLASARADIAALSATQARDHADTNSNWAASVISTGDAITTPDTWVLLGLLGVIVTFVLLIACANLANLVLARTIRRRHDFAVRLALGATRLQLVRPLLSESLLLGVCGGAAGLAIAQFGLRIINATAYDSMLQQIGIDRNVLVFTALLAILTPFLFSLWPAIGAGRAASAETLRDARTTGGRQGRKRRHVLVVAEVALALALLVVSGLILRTMINFEHLDTGLDVSRGLVLRFDPPADRYPDAAARARFARELVAAIQRVPGVTGAAVTSHLPVLDPEVVRTMTGTRHDGDTAEQRPFVSSFAATPGFFQAAGIGLVAGRLPSAADAAGTEPVAVLNRMAAEKYFDTIDAAIDRTVTLSGGATVSRVRIVGVVSDTRDSQVIRTSPQIYAVFDQAPTPAMTLLVHAASPAERGADVRAAVRRLDPGIAASTPKTLRTLVDENAGDTGIVNGLFAGFAGLALVLAAAGLYGVISHSVGQRQREIGVRLALGAAPPAIRRMVLVESLRVTGTGMLAGLLLAVGLARASQSVLFGVSTHDPLTFGGVVALVFVVSIAAVWEPASRAMRTDPARTLRAD